MALQLLTNGKLLYQEGDLRTECCCVGYCKLTWKAYWNCHSDSWIDPDNPVTAGSKIELNDFECVEVDAGDGHDWTCVATSDIREEWTKIVYIANNCTLDSECETVALANVPDLPTPGECCPIPNGQCYFTAAYYWSCVTGLWEGIFACGCDTLAPGGPYGWKACFAPPIGLGLGLDSCEADYNALGDECTCSDGDFCSSPVLFVSPTEADEILAAGDDGCCGNEGMDFECYDFCYFYAFTNFNGNMTATPAQVPYTCNGCDGACENCTSCT